MSIIDEKYIYVDLDLKTKEEIFEKIGTQLTTDGIVEESFVGALNEREDHYPTGLPLPIGVAIPHTDASHVKQDQLVIATLSEPVEFIEMGSEDERVNVQLIIMIVMKDGNSHLEMLQNIIATVQKEEVVQKVVEENNPAVIKEILEENILNRGE